MTNVGYGTLTVIPSFKGFGRSLSTGVTPHMSSAGALGGSKFGDAAGVSAGKRFGAKFKSALKVGGLAAIGGAVAAGGVMKSAISSASDLGETVAKTGEIFGKEAMPQLQKFAAGADKALGQSQQSALDAISTFGVFGKSAGLEGRDLAKFSTGLTGLSSDLASFSNTSPEEAITAIGAALRGESEPIRRFGVLLDDATLRNEALALGLVKTTKDALTPQQKVLAAQSAIYKQTQDAQGDFARTSDGLANQQRILTAEWENAKAKLGSGLLPIATKFVTFLAQKMLPGVERLAGYLKREWGPAFQAAGGYIRENILPALRDFSDWVMTKLVPALRDYAVKYIEGAKEGFANLKDSLRDNKPFLDKMVDAFKAFGKVLVEDIIPFMGDFARVVLPLVGKALGFLVTNAKSVATAWTLMVEYGAKAFGLLLDVALRAFEGILKAAEVALGWIPEFGPKIKAASAGFSAFRDEAKDKFEDIERAAREMREEINKPAKPEVDISGAMASLGKLAAEWAVSPAGVAAGANTGPGRRMGGSINPDLSPRTGATFVHNGDIVTQDPREYQRWNQERKRRQDGGGID